MSTQPIPHEMTRGDLRKTLRAILTEPDPASATGADKAINLTGASLTFTMVNNATGAKPVDAQAVSIVSAAAGSVEYVWKGAETAVAGHYHGQFLITWPGGDTQHVPHAGAFDVIIVPAVGEASP